MSLRAPVKFRQPGTQHSRSPPGASYAVPARTPTPGGEREYYVPGWRNFTGAHRPIIQKKFFNRICLEQCPLSYVGVSNLGARAL